MSLSDFSEKFPQKHDKTVLTINHNKLNLIPSQYVSNIIPKTGDVGGGEKLFTLSILRTRDTAVAEV